VLGTWVGSIVGPDGQTPADKPLRLTIVPEAGDRVRVVFDGEFVRHHAEMIRQTLEGPLEFTVLHHTQVPVELDLTYENGELRGTARLYAGNTNTPQPMVLRRLPAPPAPQVEPPRLPELPPRPQATQPARVGGRLDPNVTGCWAGGIVTEGEKVDPNESLQAVIAGTDGNLTLVLSGSMLAKPYTITGGARYNLKIQCVHRTGVPVEIDLPFVGADVWGTARIGGPDGPPRPLVLRRTTPPVP